MMSHGHGPKFRALIACGELIEHQNPHPFPGLDPYVESIWDTAHHDIIALIKEQVSGQLPPRFKVESEKLVYTTIVEDGGGDSGRRPFKSPDVNVADKRPATSGGFLAVSSVELMPDIVVETAEIELHSLKIMDKTNNAVIAWLEVLSPENKKGDGRDEYMAKRKKVLQGNCSLLELDLVRARTDLPEAIANGVEEQRYAVLHRPLGSGCGHERSIFLYPLRNRMRLVPLPIIGKDLTIDIQSVMNAGFSRQGWKSALVESYNGGAKPPLSQEDQKWARIQIDYWKSLGNADEG